MMEKRCFKCGEVKPLSDFYKHAQMGDGHLNKCKECTRTDVKENRNNNRDYYVAYDRMRYDNNPERREYAIQSARAREMANPDNKHAAIMRYRESNPEKYKAHTMVNNAIRDGKLTKQPCEVCGCVTVHAHHDDYSRPLDVRWLCADHHGKQHRKPRIISSDSSRNETNRTLTSE